MLLDLIASREIVLSWDEALTRGFIFIFWPFQPEQNKLKKYANAYIFVGEEIHISEKNIRLFKKYILCNLQWNLT